LLDTRSNSEPLVRAIDIGKSFGAVRALRKASLDLRRGESVGIVGHNGAGKSTLMNILCGTLAPDEGELNVGGSPVTSHWDVREAQRLGVRRVFQELSLCPNLTLAENMHLAQPARRGLGWRKRAGAVLMGTLDRIFPGHGLRPDHVIADLPIGQRQVVEIARAFTRGQQALDVMILDEPTSSLDSRASHQLLAYIRDFVTDGGTCVLITHKLREIFEVADRVVVMRDGAVVDSVVTGETDRERLVAAMGQDEQGTSAAGPGRATPGTAPEIVVQSDGGGHPGLHVRRGEVIGLAGLAGHGQTDLLVRLRDAADGLPDRELKVTAPAAFVAGDRQADGVFPLWSIERNMSVGSLQHLRRHGLINLSAERREVNRWSKSLGVVTPDVGLPIMSLSGGNQQKVLFARALASPARIILMDDPMRGVDVGTKHDVYELIAAEVQGGRSFIWYTTEFDELYHCDRVYVFRNGHVVGEIARGQLSEERVLSLSFEEVA
jgi:ribose transport system ATP-binding protein